MNLTTISNPPIKSPVLKSTVLAIAVMSLTACTTGNHLNGHNNTNNINTNNIPPKTIPAATGQYDLVDKHIKHHNPDQISVNGQSLADGKLNLATISTGLHTQHVAYSKLGNTINTIANRTLRIYKQPNSVVINDRTPHPHGIKAFDAVAGVGTTKLPTSDIYNYTGKAFDDKSEGQFHYAIDFSQKTGQGNFVLNDTKTVLNQANITKQTFDNQYTDDFSGFGIQGDIAGGGSYRLGIFGTTADEVAGIATLSDKTVGFGGLLDLVEK